MLPQPANRLGPAICLHILPKGKWSKRKQGEATSNKTDDMFDLKSLKCHPSDRVTVTCLRISPCIQDIIRLPRWIMDSPQLLPPDQYEQYNMVIFRYAAKGVMAWNSILEHSPIPFKCIKRLISRARICNFSRPPFSIYFLQERNCSHCHVSGNLHSISGKHTV